MERRPSVATALCHCWFREAESPLPPSANVMRDNVDTKRKGSIEEELWNVPEWPDMVANDMKEEEEEEEEEGGDKGEERKG